MPLHLGPGRTLYGHAQLLPAASTGRAGCTLAGIPSAGQACIRAGRGRFYVALSQQPPATPYQQPPGTQPRPAAGEAAAHDRDADQHPASEAHRLLRCRARGHLGLRQADHRATGRGRVGPPDDGTQGHRRSGNSQHTASLDVLAEPNYYNKCRRTSSTRVFASHETDDWEQLANVSHRAALADSASSLYTTSFPIHSMARSV